MLTYKRWDDNVRGLDAFPKLDWPGNISLLYYSYHIMVLGTLGLFLIWREIEQGPESEALSNLRPAAEAG